MDRDFASAAWAEHHDKLSNGFSRFFKSVAYAFRKLNEIEYDAPWRRTRR